MCLPIDCWLCCMPPTMDDDPAPASGARNGGHQYTGNGAYPAHSRVAAEADRKASNDVRKGGPAHHHAGAPAAAAAPRGWNGHHAATGAQEKMAAAYPYAAGADETLKPQQPTTAWNGARVAAADGPAHAARGGAPHNYYSYERAHREDAADSYYAAAATATAHHESPSEE